MGFITVDYTFASSTAADADEVMHNYKNILQGLSDGSKNISVNTFTADNITFYNQITVGTSTASTLNMNGTVITDIVPKIDSNYTIGNSSFLINALFMNNSTTHGGSIHFDKNDNKYIRSNSDGDTLSIKNFSTGIKYTEDGYIRVGAGSDLELTTDSDDAVIRNRTSDKEIDLFITSGTTDERIMNMDGSSSCAYQKSFLDGLEVNPIINGQMLIWQRATSFSTIATDAWFADRFQYNKHGTMEHTVTRHTLTSSEDPYSEGYRYAAKFDVTASQATLSNSHYVGFRTGLEGYDTAPFYGRECNISFWIKSTKVGTYSVSLSNSGATANYVHPFVISATSSWEKQIFTFTMSTFTTSTWSIDNTLGMEIYVSLGAGASQVTDSSNTWLSEGTKAITDQANSVDALGNEVYFTGLRMSIGDGFDTSNQSPDFLTELNRCERYFQTSYDYEKDVGTTHITGCYRDYRAATTGGSRLNQAGRCKRPVPMLKGYASGAVTTLVRYYAPMDGSIDYINRDDNTGKEDFIAGNNLYIYPDTGYLFYSEKNILGSDQTVGLDLTAYNYHFKKEQEVF